jgi:hypothetical protein
LVRIAGLGFVASVEPPHVQSEAVRLLHKVLGYTSNPVEAMPSEPEAVPAEYQSELTQRAGLQLAQLHRRNWRDSRRRLEDELALLRQKGFPRELESDLRVIERQLERISRRLAA